MRSKLMRQSMPTAMLPILLFLIGWSTPAHAQFTYTDLDSFGSGYVDTDDVNPLIQATDGNLYGTTSGAGTANGGTVYKISTTGTLTILHSFEDGSVSDDGGNPYGSLIQGYDGSLYGTTQGGGSAGDGTVFKITTSGTLTILHSFGDGSVADDGTNPFSGLTEGGDGNYYGTTVTGGTANEGTAYRITPAGVVTILHSFSDGSVTDDGARPGNSLVLLNGALYGCCYAGGVSNNGTAFKLTTTGAVTILRTFGDGTVSGDGGGPETLVVASDGNFYGVCHVNGSDGGGTVFKLTPAGVETVLVGLSSTTGYNPNCALIQGSDGLLYGTTQNGGSNGDGTVFNMTLTGTLTVVHNFPSSAVTNDGQDASAGLVQATNGSFYGVTEYGGSHDCGMIYELTPPGPPAPTGLTATLNGGNVELNWNTSSGATSYNVERSTSPTTGFASIGTPSTTTFTDTNPVSGSINYYFVTGVNQNGTSPPSNIVSNAPVPTLSSLNPSSATVAGPQVDVTINGSNFTANSVAQWNEVDLATTYVSTIKLTAVIPASDLTTTGSYNIDVTNDSIGDAVSNTLTFTVDNPPPTLTSVSPPSIPAGSPSTSLTATGSSFVDGSVIEWNGTKYTTTYNSSTSISATIPSTQFGAAGSADVTVFNPGPGGGTSSAILVQITQLAAPTNLIAQPGDTQAILSWQESGPATAYSILRGVTSGGESATPVATGVTSATYTDTGLTNGTTYYYEVEAANSASTSGPSNEASATPLPPPSAPTDLTATAGNTKVVLSWSAGAGATSYNVYHGTQPGVDNATPVATDYTDLTFTDTGLTNGTTYYYYVTAVNIAGVSTPAAASAEPNGAPLAPTGLTATGGNAAVALSWTASANTSSYNVYRGTSSGEESPTPVATLVAAAAFTDTTVTNAVTYYYKVAAVNVIGKSAMSNEATATPNGPPLAPTGLAAIASSGSVSLTWNATANTTSYNVYRDKTSGGEEKAYPLATNLAGTSYTDTTAANGSTYYYKVAAVNVIGTSAFSNESSATPNNVPLTPTSFRATAGNAEVTLKWAPTANTSSYNVFRSSTSGGEGTKPYASDITTNTYIDTGVTNTDTYYYEVDAVNTVGTSPLSAEVSAKPDGPPATPTGVTATAGNAMVGLSWKATMNTTSYDVYRGTTANGESDTPLAKVAGPAFTDTTVANTKTYYYMVSAANALGTSSLSSEVSATPMSTAPAVPTGLTGKPLNGAALLSWAPSTGATSYDIYRGTSSTDLVLARRNVTSAGYLDSGLTNGTTYYYKVAALDAIGASKASDSTAVTPTAPANHDLLVIENSVNGRLAFWKMNGATVTADELISPIPDVGAGWQYAGCADFNGDGQPDLLFQQAGSGLLAVWYMDGATRLSIGNFPQSPAAGWNVVGVGDFNGDGHPDLLLQNSTTNQLAIWLLNGLTKIGGATLPWVPAPGWHPVAVGDFNGDGYADILFQQTVSSSASTLLAVWYMQGTSRLGIANLSREAGPGNAVVAVDNLTTSVYPNIVLEDGAGVVEWSVEDATVTATGAISSPAPSGWSVVGPR